MELFIISFDKFRNPSAGSLVSETGSLDRMKAAAERRKKGLDDSGTTVSGRVEGTRVNAEPIIDKWLKNTKLDQVGEGECIQSIHSHNLLNYIDNVKRIYKFFVILCFRRWCIAVVHCKRWYCIAWKS